MPRIVITGIPNSLQDTEELRHLLVYAVPQVVESAEGFGISREHVYAHAIPDLVDERPARTIVFTIEGLLDRPDRTARMRRELCEAICDALVEFLDAVPIPYEAIVGWCARIDRDEDGFVRRSGPASG